MTDRECQKWISITDATAMGELVTELERVFEVLHRASCARCRAEAAIWSSLRPSPVHALPSALEVDEILAQLPNAPLGSEDRSSVTPLPLRRVLGAGMASLALVAGLLLWLKMHARPIEVTQALPTAVATAQLTAPGSHSDRRSSVPATALNAAADHFPDDACRNVVTGITLCMAAGSEISGLELSSPQRIVRLSRGRAIASLVPQPAGSSFTLATKDGSVTSSGTKVAVEVGSAGGTTVRVHQGQVMVRAAGAVGERLLVAGQAALMGSENVRSVDAGDRERDLKLLSLMANRQGDVSDSPSPSPLGDPPSDQLQRARALRSQGRFIEAAEVYRAVHVASPGSASGRAALVSLGALSLSALSDPPGALLAFSDYLAGGPGALTKEAEFGQIRALRALGRSAEADAAMDAYVLRYPAAPESVARKRASHPE